MNHFQVYAFFAGGLEFLECHRRLQRVPFFIIVMFMLPFFVLSPAIRGKPAEHGKTARLHVLGRLEKCRAGSFQAI